MLKGAGASLALMDAAFKSQLEEISVSFASWRPWLIV